MEKIYNLGARSTVKAKTLLKRNIFLLDLRVETIVHMTELYSLHFSHEVAVLPATVSIKIIYLSANPSLR